MADALLKNRHGFAQALCALSVLTNTVTCGGSHVSDAQPMQEAAGKNASPSALNSATPSAVPSGASAVSVAPPSKLLPPPTLTEAGGKCVCGEPKQIGTSAFAPNAMDILPNEPVVKVAANSDRVLAMWEDKDESLTTRPLDPDGEPTGPALTIPDAPVTRLLPLSDGNFAALELTRAWPLSPLGAAAGAPEAIFHPTTGGATSTSAGLYFRSEGLEKTWLTRLVEANGHIEVTNDQLLPADNGRNYLAPVVSATGHWYLVSVLDNVLRLESSGAAAEDFEQPTKGTPQYLAVDDAGNAFVDIEINAKTNTIYQLVHGQRTLKEVPVPDGLFRDREIAAGPYPKWAFAGRGPLEFRRHVWGRRETMTELVPCVITPNVSPYVQADSAWSKGGFIVIYEDGQPKNYRIFVSRVTCNG